MTTFKSGTKVIINEDIIEYTKHEAFLNGLIGKTLEIVEVTNEYKDEKLPTYKCKYENGLIVTENGTEYFPFVDYDLKIKRDMDRVLLNMILGHPGDVEFLLQN